MQFNRFKGLYKAYFTLFKINNVTYASGSRLETEAIGKKKTIQIPDLNS